jgi:hypothetical protein
MKQAYCVYGIRFYIKLAITIPKAMAKSLVKLNLCPSLVSKIMVDEM